MFAGFTSGEFLIDTLNKKSSFGGKTDSQQF